MEGVAEAPVGTNRRRLEGVLSRLAAEGQGPLVAQPQQEQQLVQERVVLSRLAAEGQEPPVAQPQQEQQLAPARFEFSQL